ncbi:hypothetical protein C8D88_102565 [Lentzea atacamensis]|uniref:Uncharacterized protein n=2 Tax=Lentzea atacamensis TaxID=531938 RepID=A0A316I757_9PSEU|nr:hypothetical protein C8D88_102565 [Lentzea atacamensis]
MGVREMRQAAVLFVLVLLLAASAAPRHLSPHDQRQIEEMAQRYLQHRADKVTNRHQTPGFGVPTTDALAAELRTDETRLGARRTMLGSLGFGGYSRAEVNTSLLRLNVPNGGGVVVHLRELTHLYFERSRSVTHTSYGMTHVLIFNSTTTGWVLAVATRPPHSKCGLPPETQFCGPLSER